MAPLPYAPLSPERREVRVVTVLAAGHQKTSTPQTSAAAPIRCTLRTVSLDDEPRPQYEALSYVWGNAAVRTPIFVDGVEYPVTPNLEAFLRRVRQPDRDRVVWADAICINQSDPEEKKTQIPLMGPIYAGAIRVLAFLGEQSNPNIDLTIAYIQGHTNILNTLKESVRSGLQLLGIRPKIPESEVTHMTRLIIGFHDLFASEYWTRMWTFQEIILAASDPVLLCGAHQLTCGLARISTAKDKLNTFAARVNDDLQNNGLKGEPTPEGRAAQEDLSSAVSGRPELRNLLHSNMRVFAESPLILPKLTIGPSTASEKLCYLLDFVAERESTEPLDRLYALYGLLPDLARTMLVDYARAPPAVFWQATVFALREGCFDLGFLLRRFSTCDGHLSKVSVVPSWTPDFSRSVFKAMVASPYHYRYPCEFAPSLCGVIPARPTFSASGRTMRVAGVSIGRCAQLELLPVRLMDIAVAIIRILDDQQPRLTATEASLFGPILQFARQMRRKRRQSLLRTLQAHNTTDNLFQFEAALERDVVDVKGVLGLELQNRLSGLSGKALFQVVSDGVQLQGIGSGHIQEGDEAVLMGFEYPAILRRVSGEEEREEEDNVTGLGDAGGEDGELKHAVAGRYRLVGLVYIDGLMDNDGFDRGVTEELKGRDWQNFDLV